MSEIEAARGAFESWLRRENGKWADKITERHPDGRYCAMQAYMDWGAWQAAWAWRESELSALKAQRDELLAAARATLKATDRVAFAWKVGKCGPLSQGSCYISDISKSLDMTRAAIANAEKDKP